MSKAMTTKTQDDNHSLTLNTFPGIYRWIHDGNGVFHYGRGALGGSGSGQHDAKQVAETVIQFGRDLPAIVSELERLGWQDVLVPLKRLIADKEKQALAKRIEYLKSEIASLRAFMDKHKGWDYEQFRCKVYDDLVAANGGKINEDDVSVRRMHYAAMSMLGTAERLEWAEKELAKLENVKLDSQSTQGTLDE
jgi:hypothetical protein